METPLKISAKNELPEAMDYQKLRERGLHYIEQLASNNWTDYNTHDPGITLLEVLCYALTDLGYRAHFPMSDLLADEWGEHPGADNAMFSPVKVLSNKALTNSDYRKILIDIDGIKNAWIKITGTDGPAIYAHCKKSILTFEETAVKVDLKGFYNVFLSFESDPELGDLNDDSVNLLIGGNLGDSATLEFAFPALDHQSIGYPDVEISNSIFNNLKRIRKNVFEAELEIEHGGESLLPNQKTLIRLLKVFSETEISLSDLQSILNNDTIEKVALVYDTRQKRIASLIQLALQKLHANRNLCEDFIHVRRIENEGIGVCADVQVDPVADIDKIQAEIYLKIINYLDPGVRFYSLQNLLGKGLRTDEIFNGPALENGFILQDELLSSQLRQTIYTSDLIAEIMQIPGVVSVSGTVISSFNSWFYPLKSGEKWCLKITPGKKPHLLLNRSKFLFLKDGIPFNARQNEVEDTLEVLLEMERLERIPEGPHDYPAPSGRFRDPARYYSLQHDLPKAYGVGQEGPFDPLTPERIALSRQLKAFLFLSDQILANYFAQVGNIRHFFSLDPNVKHTLFSQFPESVPNASVLFNDVTEFKALLPNFTEDSISFLEKRNRILDHLLARFSENFSDYVTLMYRTGFQQLEQERVINDKSSFLKHYPLVSSAKHHGINYRYHFNGWSQPSGIAQRLGLLLGASLLAERSLLGVYPLLTELEDSTFRFSICRDPEFSETLLEGKVNYATELEAREALLKTIDRFYFPESYKAEEENPGEFHLNIYIGEDLIATWDTVFPSEKEALDFLRNLLGELRNQSEGFHIIENILLRPKDTDYKLFAVSLPQDCQFCGEEDPYSFRLTIVLPYWPDRFTNNSFRRYAGNTIRREIPAHLLPRICWVSPQQVYEFEETYLEWRTRQAATEKDSYAVRLANDNLIAIIEKLRSVYPEATLHDCIDDSDTNPVLLNQTQLGTFKADEDGTDQ